MSQILLSIRFGRRVWLFSEQRVRRSLVVEHGFGVMTDAGHFDQLPIECPSFFPGEFLSHCEAILPSLVASCPLSHCQFTLWQILATQIGCAQKQGDRLGEVSRQRRIVTQFRWQIPKAIWERYLTRGK